MHTHGHAHLFFLNNIYRAILEMLARKCGKEILELVPILPLRHNMIKSLRREKNKKKKLLEGTYSQIFPLIFFIIILLFLFFIMAVFVINFNRLEKKNKKHEDKDKDESEDSDDIDDENLFSLPKASKTGTWIMEV